MVKIYLDTSALAKRYVEEEGTEIVDFVFNQASTEHKLVFSFWNLGECLVVFDKYHNRGHLTQEQLKDVIQRLMAEGRELFHKGFLVIVPVSVQLLVDSWRHILGQHIYAGDAVQIATFELEGCDFLLAADKKFLQVCKSVGIEGYNVELESDVKRIQRKFHS